MATRPGEKRQPTPRGARPHRGHDVEFAIGAARALGGAIVFALPLLMTAEMWSLGFVVPAHRLAILLLALVPLLVMLSYYAGFRDTFSLKQDAVDALVAIAIAGIASALALLLLAVLDRDSSPREAIGGIALQIVPASIGALLAQSQLGHHEDPHAEEPSDHDYLRELFLMIVGALFLGFNIAPTEEVVAIAHMMTGWHALAAVLVSVATMHAFVYAVEFRGQETCPAHLTPTGAFLLFTVVGYVLVLLVCAYVLWTFGRFDHIEWPERLRESIVLAIPSSVGAAAARLLL